ncbi:hypothetical protein [Streptomyces sp. A0592]|uniref:hypothetical protein n=1 Tax=Streptomyces sp. A0592 TaxID=2563099 RepID=UPI00109EA83E|nr:hypothetical protein [Streptomyces sp. A0592]THA82756.1 hypothetical protein E6U81_19630 [Streptomyces sp. A0592]
MTARHATTAQTMPALMATINELRALNQPLVEALQRIHGDMETARSGGDEWAMEWFGDMWSSLPLAVRAAGGDEDAANELADLTRATEGAACSTPNPCEDGELCDRHEREQAHTDEEHALCGPECAGAGA